MLNKLIYIKKHIHTHIHTHIYTHTYTPHTIKKLRINEPRILYTYLPKEEGKVRQSVLTYSTELEVSIYT